MDIKLGERYWDNRWKTLQTGWDIGHASAPLSEYINQLKNKDLKILIPGCGNAWEGEYLYKLGFTNVFLIDLSKTVLDNFQRRLPDFPSSHLIHGDFFELNEHFELILEQTFFCALDPKLRATYAKKVYELLKPNGKLVGVLFNCEFGNKYPPYGGNKEEYLGYFSELFDIKYFEEAYNSIKPRSNRELFIQLIKLKEG